MNKALVFLGSPGSGKGTQAKLLQKEFDFFQVSTGEMLRREVSSGTSLGNMIKSVMDSGGLVDDVMVERLLENNIQEGKNYIFDGFPRNLRQAVFLDSFLLEKKISLVRVFYFHIENDYVIKRLLERRVCSICNGEFNVNFHKIKGNICPNCLKQSLVIRNDDNELTIKDRMKVYLEETVPVFDFYKKKNIFFVINAMNTIDSVFCEICDKLLGVIK